MTSKYEVYTDEQRKADFKNIVDIQSSEENCRAEYHRGMANGLILGFHVAYEPYGSDVKYIEVPEGIKDALSQLTHALKTATYFLDQLCRERAK